MKIERKLNKMYAGAIALMMVSIIFASVFATRTFTDSNDTWTGTIVQSGNLDFKSGAYFNLSKKIWTSAGKVYNVTGANIQAALYSLNATGGTVWLPSGTIALPATYGIKLVNNTALVGAGMYITILQAPAGSYAAAAWIQCWDTGTSKRRSNIILSDLTIDGNSRGNSTLVIDTTTNFTVENVRCINAYSSGFYIGGDTAAHTGCKRGVISNCIAYDCNKGGGTNQAFSITYVNDTIIDNCFAYMCSSVTYGFDFHTLHNCTVNNILVKHCGKGVKITGDSGEWGGNSVYSNINIYNTTDTATAGFRMLRTYNTSITNVNVHNVSYHGVFIDGCSYVTIKNLQVDELGSIANRRGILIDNSAGSVSHLTIDGGFVRNPTAASLVMDTANNVTFSNFVFSGATNDNEIVACKDFRFIGCTFEKGTYGLDFITTASSRFQIVGCSFIGNSIDAIDTTHIACDNYTISDCVFYANVKAIDLHASDNYFTIHGCVCQVGDIIDLNGAVDNVTARCNKFDNIASITWT